MVWRWLCSPIVANVCSPCLLWLSVFDFEVDDFDFGLEVMSMICQVEIRREGKFERGVRGNGKDTTGLSIVTAKF